MKNKTIKLAKNLLIGNGCKTCEYGADLWHLADDKIKCSKNKKIMKVNDCCKKWKLANPVELYEREFLINKYELDKVFIKRIEETTDILKRDNHDL